MRKHSIRCAWASMFLLLPLCVSGADADDAAAREAVVTHYRSGADPMVEAAEWTGNIFNVGIHFMGAGENGLASEICKVLASHGVARHVRVRVIDINSMGGDQKRWETVGQATCR